MNAIVYHIVSGQAFFTGAILITLAAVLRRHSRSFVRRLSILFVIVGGVLVVVSSTPLPYWLYALCGVATLWLLASGSVPTTDPAAPSHRRWLRRGPQTAAVVWSIALLLELPFVILPQLETVPERSITIIGDSVTAGNPRRGRPCSPRNAASTCRTFPMWATRLRPRSNGPNGRGSSPRWS